MSQINEILSILREKLDKAPKVDNILELVESAQRSALRVQQLLNNHNIGQEQNLGHRVEQRIGRLNHSSLFCGLAGCRFVRRRVDLVLDDGARLFRLGASLAHVESDARVLVRNLFAHLDEAANCGGDGLAHSQQGAVRFLAVGGRDTQWKLVRVNTEDEN